MIFSYAPFVIPFSSLLKNSNKNKEFSSPIYLVFYALILVLIGIIANSRGLFMRGLTAIGLVLFLGLLIGRINYKIFNFKFLILAFSCFWIVNGPISQLSTAMVIVRGQRHNISSNQLIDETFRVFNDNQSINEYKKLVISKIGNDWDEHYFDNIFLSRFCNLKYSDSNLNLALKLDDNDTRMLGYSIDRFWAILPEPVINFLNINIDKKKITSSSLDRHRSA
jgi:hypothetical protein